MALVDAYGLIFTKGREEPVLFVRHGNRNSYRFGGCCRLSNDPVGVQTPLHDEDMAQKEETGEFRALSEEPWIYGYGTEKPFSEYRYFYENGLITGTWYEGKERYRHRVYYTFTENMEAYDENLKSYGFDVKD